MSASETHHPSCRGREDGFRCAQPILRSCQSIRSVDRRLAVGLDLPARDHVLEMREHGEPRRLGQARIEPDIDRADDRGDVGFALGQPMHDRGLAAFAVLDVFLHEGRRLAHQPAMSRQIDRLCAPRELPERIHVIAHRAVGRRHHRRRPRHHVVTREQQPGFLEGERHVIGGVAGRRHRLDGEAVAGNHLAIGERTVGTEIGIVAGIEARGFSHVERPRGTVRPFRQHQRAGRGLDRRHRWRMVAVGMGDENMRHRLAAHGIEQRSDVRLVEWTRIDDGDLSLAHDVGDCALERERTRIVGEHAAHARQHLLDRVGRELEALVEWNVVAHANPYPITPPGTP